jgi:TolA-binding protein
VAARPFELQGDLDVVISPELQDRLEAVRDRIGAMRLDLNTDIQAQIDIARDNAVIASRAAEVARERVREMAPQIADAARIASGIGIGVGRGFAFAPQITPPAPPAPAARPMTIRGNIYNMSADSAYSSGQRALDSRQWENAVTYFSQVISRNTTRVDGALYWKAYAQAKLGRRDDALATIAELRKSHAGSKWLDDAKALEIEVNQGVRQMSPEAESDEDMKLLIMSSGLQTDFDRFYPALEKIVKGSSSPKLKRNALYVLAENSSPKAQALVEQVARGGANPDLQVKAIEFMVQRRRSNMNANAGQILADIYGSTNDNEVKRAVLEGLVNLKDKDRLVAVLRTEKNQDLRRIPIRYFGDIQGNAELWSLYPGESTTEGKILILEHALRNGNADKLVEVLRNEKETKVRVAAVRALASYPTATDSLVSVYSTEQDPQVKQAIIDAVYSQRNGKAMVDLAKAEKDTKLKIRLVERLGNMKNCKECSDYLLEILNK